MNDFNAFIRVLRYFKSCLGRGIFLPRDSQIKLQGYSDVDWIGCSDTRRSISEHYFFLARSLISLRTKKQLTISRSSSEVEYRALGATTCELQ